MWRGRKRPLTWAAEASPSLRLSLFLSGSRLLVGSTTVAAWWSAVERSSSPVERSWGDERTGGFEHAQYIPDERAPSSTETCAQTIQDCHHYKAYIMCYKPLAQWLATEMYKDVRFSYLVIRVLILTVNFNTLFCRTFTRLFHS